jgi:glutamine synthetase type III
MDLNLTYKVLNSLVPKTKFHILDDKTLVWKDERKQPTEIEIENKVLELNIQQKKQKELNELQVNLNNISYDAHMEGIGNMGLVIGGMTYKFIKELVKQNPKMQALYDDIFKQIIEWKGADNKTHSVHVESIAQTLEKAMHEKAKIVFKY